MRFPVVLLFVSAGLTAAADISESARCIISIAEALSRLRFIGPSNSTFIIDACTNKLRTYSLYAAAKLYCSLSEIEDGSRVLDGECEKEGLERTPYNDIEPELSEEFIAGLRVVEFGEVNKEIRLSEPVLISHDYFWRAFRTNVSCLSGFAAPPRWLGLATNRRCDTAESMGF